MSKPVYIVPMSTAHSQGNAIARTLGVLDVFSTILNSKRDILFTETTAKIAKECLEDLQAAQDKMIAERRVNINFGEDDAR